MKLDSDEFFKACEEFRRLTGRYPRELERAKLRKGIPPSELAHNSGRSFFPSVLVNMDPADAAWLLQKRGASFDREMVTWLKDEYPDEDADKLYLKRGPIAWRKALKEIAKSHESEPVEA